MCIILCDCVCEAVQGKNVLSSPQTDGVCVCTSTSWSGDRSWKKGVCVCAEQSDQMTKNKADEKINPVARDEMETGRKERMMEILGQEEMEWRRRRLTCSLQECSECCSFIIHLHGKRSFTY